jgi:hypothetical protein
VGITLFSLKNPYQSLNEVSLLQQVASSQTLVTKSIDESHGVLENSSISTEKQLVNDLSLALLGATVQQVVVHERVDYLLLSTLATCLCESPPEGLQSSTDFDGFTGIKQEVFDLWIDKWSQRRLLFGLVLTELLLLQLVLLLLNKLALLAFKAIL